MNYKKKAIEPIVATILLVVVAVILVTIVLAWGRNFATTGTNQANEVISNACSGATIAISDCSWDNTADTATFLITNTSDTYTFAKDDFSCGVISSTAPGTNDLTGVADGEALNPGQKKPLTCIDANVDATKVTLKVWSETCPNMAVGELKNC
jgi:cytoskeletal protein RodZ